MSHTIPSLKSTAIQMLTRWAGGSKRFLHPLTNPDEAPARSVFGPGYVSWGTQACWLYTSALATLGAETGDKKWTENAKAVLHYLFHSHHSGPGFATDGTKWGRTWISVLGIERAMHGVYHLRNKEVNAALERLLADECSDLLHHGNRAGVPDVAAGLWNASGKNSPESNIWNGCHLWRGSEYFPGHPESKRWAERTHDYLVNGISIPKDIEDQTMVAGKPVAARHVGANFFPNYALDHHGYLNVGYMVICLSNAAILHFDARREKFSIPQSLTHHLRDLWEVVRGFLFADGRLARIGGDTRARYAYCQEYILPVLLYAADVYQDAHALGLAESFLKIMETEQAGNPSGLFFEKRLAPLIEQNPYYYTRLESDRACVLAMLCNYLPLVNASNAPLTSFSFSAQKNWREDEHGAAMTRNEKRLASFSWRAQGLAQALCLPPDRSDLAEWNRNLTPVVAFIGKPGNHPDRRLIQHGISPFDNGFVTSGCVAEGIGMNVEEGASMTDQAFTRLAFAALPDGQTCVGIQYVVTSPERITYTTSVKSLHLNIPNDLLNDFKRRYLSGGKTVSADADREDLLKDRLISLPSNQLSIDDCLHLDLIYGGHLFIHQNARRHDRLASILCDEVVADFSNTTCRHEANTVLADLAFSLVSGNANPAPETAVLSQEGEVRAVSVRGCDQKKYVVVMNVGSRPANFRFGEETLLIPAIQARVGVLDDKKIRWLSDFGEMRR